MRILGVIPYFYPAWAYGGPVRVAYEAAKALAERGHQVSVFTTDARDGQSRVKGPNAAAVDGVAVRRFRNVSNGLAYRHHVFVSPAMLPAAAREVGTFDVVHLHEYRTLQNAVVGHYARQRRTAYVVQAHGSLPRIMGKGGLKSAFDAVWGRTMLRGAARVLAINESEARGYESMGVDSARIAIVPHGIDSAAFERLPARGAFRQRHGIGLREKVVLYVGRIHAIKGLDTLAGSFAGLAGRAPGARLVFVGPDDGYLRGLKELVQSLGIGGSVIFAGPLYGEAEVEAYVDADVCVLPSSYEIFGMTALEACACGTAVVVTDRCGIAPAVRDRGGLVVPYGDAAALQEALRAVLEDEGLRGKLGEGGRRLVREEFDWSRVIDRLEAIYGGAVESGRLTHE